MAHTGIESVLPMNRRGNRKERAMRAKRGRHERVECRHRQKMSIETAGLRRTVCQRCRSVTVDFLYDVFAEEQKQLRRLAR
jgi:hypothetical protein